jgi:hypothetical protein
MPCHPPFLVGPVRGLATMSWGSTFPSSDHWALTADCCALTASCRVSSARSRSRARPRRRADAAPGLASLACGLREQAASPHWIDRALCEPGHEGRCRPRPHADFVPVAREFKKFIFYFLFSFKLNSNFKNLYLNIQSFKTYEINFIGFIIF